MKEKQIERKEKKRKKMKTDRKRERERKKIKIHYPTILQKTILYKLIYIFFHFWGTKRKK